MRKATKKAETKKAKPIAVSAPVLRRSTGGAILVDLPPVAPLPTGEKYDPLELGRGLDTAKPPRRVIGPHGRPPRGLSQREKGIFFFEGIGSVETRTGVAWDREFHRRLDSEKRRENVERELRPGVDVTPTDSGRKMVGLPWGIRGAFVRMVESPRVKQDTGPERVMVTKSADGSKRKIVMKMHDVCNVPASKQVLA